MRFVADKCSDAYYFLMKSVRSIQDNWLQRLFFSSRRSKCVSVNHAIGICIFSASSIALSSIVHLFDFLRLRTANIGHRYVICQRLSEP